MYKQLMLTVDGSTLSELALPHATKLASCFDATLHVVRVVMPFALLVPTTVEYSINENYRQQALADAHTYLDQIQKKVGNSFSGDMKTKVLEGIVVDSILDYADFHGIDLIIMATHGRSGIGRWVFGSVAERVLHAATMPVFIVRAFPELLKSAEEKSERQSV